MSKSFVPASSDDVESARSVEVESGLRTHRRRPFRGEGDEDENWRKDGQAASQFYRDIIRQGMEI